MNVVWAEVCGFLGLDCDLVDNQNTNDLALVKVTDWPLRLETHSHCRGTKSLTFISDEY